MTNFQTDYQSLVSAAEDSEVTPDDDVIFHVSPEKSRWNHIDDLDSFFRRCYRYHQQGGFLCISVTKLFHLLQTIFIVSFALYTANCINYADVDKQFYSNSTTKTSITDVFVPVDVCVSSFNRFTWFFIIVAIVFWIYSLLRTIYCLYCFYEIRNFYISALKIAPYELQNIPWHEVQCKLREVQREQLMCIHKQDLSELDIYHRILRHENYMIAMMNKNILPVKYNVRGLNITYFPPLLRFILSILLFRSPYSPFKSTWQLKEEYKKFSNRYALANRLSQGFLWLMLFCALSSVVIFIFILMFFCVDYAAHIRKEPGFLSTRKWSPYAMLYLRHFNELDHEFNSRLNRAYSPSTRYMNSFYSQALCITTRNIAGITGVIAVFFLVWAAIQPVILEYLYGVTICAVCGSISTVCMSYLPKENAVFAPDLLLRKVIAEINYMPDSWIGKAACPSVRKEFSQLFQLRITSIVEHLISPFIVPLILYRLRTRALDIVDFFRSFTVEVAGVGDVCSFALMDISRHGNHEWVGDAAATKADHFQQAENGKTELSLIHFTITNPNWQSPPASSAFINNVKEQAQRHAREIQGSGNMNALFASLHSLQPLQSGHSSCIGELTTFPGRQAGSRHPLTQSLMHQSMLPANTTPVYTGNVNRTEGPLYCSENGILASVLGSEIADEMLHRQDITNPLEFRGAEISFNSLYLHELHQRRLQELRQPRVLTQVQHQQSHLENKDAGDSANNEQQPLLDPRTLNSS